MGRNGIPCIGFGPGAEAQAHAPNEKLGKMIWFVVQPFMRHYQRSIVVK